MEFTAGPGRESTQVLGNRQRGTHRESAWGMREEWEAVNRKNITFMS